MRAHKRARAHTHKHDCMHPAILEQNSSCLVFSCVSFETHAVLLLLFGTKSSCSLFLFTFPCFPSLIYCKCHGCHSSDAQPPTPPTPATAAATPPPATAAAPHSPLALESLVGIPQHREGSSTHEHVVPRLLRQLVRMHVQQHAHVGALHLRGKA
jgi:hypothetical protein